MSEITREDFNELRQSQQEILTSFAGIDATLKAFMEHQKEINTGLKETQDKTCKETREMITALKEDHTTRLNDHSKQIREVKEKQSESKGMFQTIGVIANTIGLVVMGWLNSR